MSLSTMPSIYIQIVTIGKISSFFMDEYFHVGLGVGVYHSFFVHSVIDDHLVFFHMLVIVNNGTVHMGG